MTAIPSGWDGERPDLRTVSLGTTAWIGALVGLHLAVPRLVPGLAVATASAVWLGLRGRATAAVLVVVAAALALLAAARVAATDVGPVPAWADARAVATVVLTVRSDPVTRTGRHGDYVVVEARTLRVEARGRTVETAVPLLVVGEERWSEVRLGSRVEVTGRLSPSYSAEHAAVLDGGSSPVVVRPPGVPLRAAERARAAVRQASAGGPADAAALVPALVTGDDQALDPVVVEAFRTAGLTHLTAVSGTNLTIVLASVLLLARWCRVRARGILVVGLVGVTGFVLLARPEPSVLRAAVMGTVALLGLAASSRAAGVRALGAAVFALLLYDPWLAVSAGFALSVLATAGILFVAPEARDALARWLPRPLAEAVAVPLAAQLACTPVVAALSGSVSLVAVAANLAVAPVVAPATVLGLMGGLAGLVLPGLGGFLGWLAAWCAYGIVLVARLAAALPAASVPWPGGLGGLVALTALSATAILAAPSLLRRRAATAVVTVLLVVVVAVPLPSRGWPPPGWVMVVCDVGQGDAVLVRTDRHEALLVDAGPDPSAVDRCLDRVGIDRLPAVVLTHFHADHVDGLPGVLAGRRVGEVQVTGLAEPAAAAASVRRWAVRWHLPVRVPAYGERASAGSVHWRVLGPARLTPGNPNDSSLVLLVESHGLRLLLLGDAEPPAQATLARGGVGEVDVLKVAHHGSAAQDEGLLASLRPRAALVSVGRDNDYGHPDPRLLRFLANQGALVRRTDRDGDIAVVARDGELRLVTRGPR